MDMKQNHGRVVPNALSHDRRADDVRKENGPYSRVALVVRTGNEDRTRWIRFTSAEECLCKLRLDLDNFLCHQAVCFTVHRRRRLRTRRTDEAEYLAAVLVEPILEVLDAVLPLRPDIGFVRLGNVFRSSSVDL